MQFSMRAVELTPMDPLALFKACSYDSVGSS